MKLNAPTVLRRYFWIVLVASFIAALALAVLVLKHQANSGLGSLLRSELRPGAPDSTNLIVIVHAYMGGFAQMKDVEDAVRVSRPDADILMVEYPAWTFSNANCFEIAEKLREEVHRRYEEKRYSTIEFVGFSMGALLARKAFVYGHGRSEDLDQDIEAEPKRSDRQEWVKSVKRFVLLAGMNRGWTTRSRPRGMKLSRQLAYRTGKFVGWATGTGLLIRQCEAGEPFVANLRMQWLEVVRALPPEERPTIIQLLGDIDDVVSDEDNRDVNLSKDFIWVQLTQTGHADAVNFQQPDVGASRAKKFRQALGDQDQLNVLRRASVTRPQADDEQVEEAVIVLHGIRDLGEWTSQFEERLQERFLETHPTGKLHIFRPSYGYFPMGSFLLWPERQRNVRWFMDELTELKAKYPRLTKLHFIGHSNGTYVLASALRKYKTLSVNRVVFAGSVVRRDFDWTSPSLKGRVEAVRSYVASSDIVVGWFPRLFEIPPFSLLNDDIGSAGFNGFTKPQHVPADVWGNFLFETKFVEGAHSAALTTANVPSIVSFVAEKGLVPPVKVVDRGFWDPLRLSTEVPWLVWAGIIFVIVLAGRLWFHFVSRFIAKLLTPRLVPAATWASYCLLIWFLLQHV